LGGRGLIARRQQLLEVPARFVGVLHQSVGHHRVRMADQAHRGVGEVADVAAVDDDALAIAKVGDVGLDVLSRDYRRKKETEDAGPGKRAQPSFHGHVS
jgi:hypothetical protein